MIENNLKDFNTTELDFYFNNFKFMNGMIIIL